MASYRAVFLILVISLLPLSARAGSACPIPDINDLGVPSWLDRGALLNELQVQQAWIGIKYRTTDTGMTLNYVHPQSPAAAAGLQHGDLVTEINGVLVTNAQELEALFDSKSSGDRLSFTLSDQSIVTLTVGHTDPVPLGIKNAIQKEYCGTSQLWTSDDAERARIMPMLFSEDRSFRCYDAHIALQSLGEFDTISDVYVVRGSRRILITMPYWGTTCVNVSALDGDNYTVANLFAVIDSITNDYMAYWEQRP
jgi:hypothetical protein